MQKHTKMARWGALKGGGNKGEGMRRRRSRRRGRRHIDVTLRLSPTAKAAATRKVDTEMRKDARSASKKSNSTSTIARYTTMSNNPGNQRMSKES